MSGCPTREALIAHLDGEATVNQAAGIAEHLRDCAACRQAEAQLRQVSAALKTVGVRAVERGVGAAVLARLELAETEGRVRRQQLKWASGLALIALVSFGASLLRSRGAEREAGRFAERGPGNESIEKARSKRLGFAAKLGDRTLVPNDRVAFGAEGLHFTIFNRTAAPTRVMLLAIDQAGEVHWFHPAYLDPASDPAPLILAADRETFELPESVAPEDATPGGLLLVGVFDAEPGLTVKAVEAQLGHPATIEKLVAPGRVIQTLPLILEESAR